MLNLSVVLEDSARRHPDRTAMVCAGRRLTVSADELSVGRTGASEWCKEAS